MGRRRSIYKLNPNWEQAIYKLNPNWEQAIVYGEKALQRATLQGNKEKEGSACGCIGIGMHSKCTICIVNLPFVY
jgi:hypothetical protein